MRFEWRLLFPVNSITLMYTIFRYCNEEEIQSVTDVFLHFKDNHLRDMQPIFSYWMFCFLIHKMWTDIYWALQLWPRIELPIYYKAKQFSYVSPRCPCYVVYSENVLWKNYLTSLEQPQQFVLDNIVRHDCYFPKSWCKFFRDIVKLSMLFKQSEFRDLLNSMSNGLMFFSI